ncbi:aldolase [Neobacillus vireti]|uniref:aldolase n=1 Tax=Neobacillus vireti TaxID=220686 RepID=UPI003000F337
MFNTREKTFYKAFGFNIVSDIIFPELTTINEPQEKHDIQIIMSDEIKYKSELEKRPYFHMVRENQVLFFIPEVAFFSIQEGYLISFSPLKNVDEGLLRLYILGTCMGVILMKRKILPLHGSAVEISGKVYAFIGESGAGKSTLASAFLNQGFSLLSDDVIPITIQSCSPFVTPSYPQQKLWQESLDQLGIGSTNYQSIYDRETKYQVPIADKFKIEPRQLAGVFELSKKEGIDDIQLLKIGKLKGFQTLFDHTYRNFLIPRLGLLDWHFDMSSKIINEIDLYQLHRPTGRFTANDLVSMILSTVKKEEDKL